MELTINSTEYNISQKDLFFGAAFITSGVTTTVLGAQWSIRGGAGIGASDDNHAGIASFVEISGQLPLTDNASMRLAYRDGSLTRTFDRDAPHSADTSLLLVFANAPERSDWAYGSGIGISAPGILVGKDLDLSLAPSWRLMARRRVNTMHAITLTYVSATHESTRKTLFMGFPGNERGKTINSLGIDWTYEFLSAARVFADAGAGAEIADWSDGHGLLQSDTGPVFAGVEVAPALKLNVGVRLTRTLAITASAEQLYWSGTHLGETRIVVGLMSVR